MIQRPKIRPLLILLCFVLSSSSIVVSLGFAWSNGGYSVFPSNPDYGTHDWIAQHAKNWLPITERQWIDEQLNLYLYGTEYPDNHAASYGTTHGYGDTVNHHNYYTASGIVLEDNAAMRAQEEYDKALVELKAGRNDIAALYSGSMTHYIADVAVFGHVMTGEIHHDDYERYVNSYTMRYTDGTFEPYLMFDGTLEIISAYNASLWLGRNTFSDDGGNYTADWMDENYDWNNPAFTNRCGESLNLATNYIAAVLHTLYRTSESTLLLSHVVINEFEQNPLGKDIGNEWVELYNPTASPVNISRWIVSTTHQATVSVTIPLNTTLEVYGYYICSYDHQWLDNDNESIVLKNDDGVEIDRAPPKSDRDNDNVCWARFPSGYDTNLSSDWRFQYATKGASNGKA